MGKKLTTRKHVYDILEHGFEGSRASRLFGGFIVVLIILNVSAIILESYQPIAEMYHQEFLLFNSFSVVVFTLSISRESGFQLNHRIVIVLRQ